MVVPAFQDLAAAVQGVAYSSRWVIFELAALQLAVRV